MIFFFFDNFIKSNELDDTTTKNTGKKRKIE